jgi:hypothetical protein
MGHTITSQFVRHNLPGFTVVAAEQALEESLRRCTIPICLKIYIDHLTILIDSPPELMLLTVYLYEDLVDEKGITVATMTSFQSSSV